MSTLRLIDVIDDPATHTKVPCARCGTEIVVRIGPTGPLVCVDTVGCEARRSYRRKHRRSSEF